MQDVTLLSKISDGLTECCKRGNISKVSKMSVIVNEESMVNEDNLSEYLKNYNQKLIDAGTEIKIEIGDLPSQVAIIKNIEGDKIE
ncbi:hypothetical protein [Clostridium felsineum]|uniref:Uncharacterized protein n=1 Tax=Clostridium felsineum TaxID=36839 RepID=A0A1S8LP92_9CLOT|nr:hypothetical protein [Clostridium felsineum]MCR3761300.1 hypothetical protein [Clostridium felsineum]URZ01512.1 hypothetical protein CLAUR_015070 [Clostridium felsineum]URZ05640.1 hypothetical protein CLROS_009660 [Clostridium felsineum]URZ10679.1 hypothetical protein CROST_013890 [Clostridium felsineum]URZ17406.1 hypothetical protein CLFE_034590 [Clostridium felsineum DSM 794]